MSLPIQDLKHEQYSKYVGEGFGLSSRVAVRVTHLPTGLTVEEWRERGLHKNRVKAMETLEQYVMDYYKEPQMIKPHKHADLIKLWADGARIEVYSQLQNKWVDSPVPQWEEDREFRVKPEKEYPKSSLTYEELAAIWNDGGNVTMIADAAVKRYIQEQEAQDGKA